MSHSTAEHPQPPSSPALDPEALRRTVDLAVKVLEVDAAKVRQVELLPASSADYMDSLAFVLHAMAVLIQVDATVIERLRDRVAELEG